MTRFILHIGPHKTGTTYIQSCLTRNRETLLRDGIYYPTEWLTPEVAGSHVGLVEALKRGDELAVTAPLSFIKARGFDIVLISSEDLSTLTDEALQLLRNKLDGDIEVVFYLRRWSELLRSGAQELVLHGLTTRLPEFCGSALSAPYDSPLVNFAITLDRFAKIFGKHSLKLISYNNVIDEGSDLLLHFVSHVLGRQIGDLEQGEPVHRSPSVYDSEILRVMNVFRNQRQIEPSLWDAGRIIRTIDRSELRTTRNAMRASTEYLSLNEFLRPFSDIYRVVANTYGQNIVHHQKAGAANLLFERKSAAIPYVQPDYLMYEAVAAELTDLFSRLTSAAGAVDQPLNFRLTRPAAPAALDPVVLVLELGRDSDGTNHLGSGWSAGEAGFRWMTGGSSELWLESPGRESDYVLELKVLPYIHAPHIRVQRLIVSVQGAVIGRSELTDQRNQVVRYRLPRNLLADAGPVRVVLEHPDGARPSNLSRSQDGRELSISVSRLTLLRIPGTTGRSERENGEAQVQAPAAE